MKHIEKDELYDHVSEFLRAKGIDLKEGSYTNFIHNGCKVLAEAVNLSQQGLERARNGLNEKLDQMRQVIHEKTAPKPPPGKPASEPPKAADPAAARAETGPKPPGAPPAPAPRKAGKTKRRLKAKAKAEG